MTNENESNEIKNAEFDGGVMTMSAQGMRYEDEDNEIETTEYCWKMNRGDLYRDLAQQVNENLNQAVQGLRYCDIAEPLVLSFPSYAITKHFANQLESHGWVTTLCPDDDIVQVDVVASIDQADKDMDVISQGHHFNQDDSLGLN